MRKSRCLSVEVLYHLTWPPDQVLKKVDDEGMHVRITRWALRWNGNGWRGRNAVTDSGCGRLESSEIKTVQCLLLMNTVNCGR